MVYGDGGFGKYCAKGIFHDDISSGVAGTGAIEENVFHHGGHCTQFCVFANFTFDQIGGVEKWVEAHGIK